MNEQEKQVIEHALSILNSHFNSRDIQFTDGEYAKNYFSLQLAAEWREVFSICFLNIKNELITFKKLFWGSIAESAVYPRVIAKEALLLDASAVIICHNHPSGHVEPSHADKILTDKLLKALKLLDIKLLDHIIVSNSKTFSFAEEGLI